MQNLQGIIFDTDVCPLYFSGRSIEPITINAMCQLVEDNMNVKDYVLTDSVVSAPMSYLIIYPSAPVSRLVSQLIGLLLIRICNV